MTSEVQVPLGDEEPGEIVESLSQVKGRVDGVAVSEIEFEGVVTDTIKTCGLLKDNNLNAIYQTTTRDKNRYQLQKISHRPMKLVWIIFWCLLKITGLQGIHFRNQCSFMLIQGNWHR